MFKEYIILAVVTVAAVVPFGALTALVIFSLRRVCTQIDGNSAAQKEDTGKVFKKIDDLGEKVNKVVVDLVSLKANTVTREECDATRATCDFPQFSRTLVGRVDKIERDVEDITLKVNQSV